MRSPRPTPYGRGCAPASPILSARFPSGRVHSPRPTPYGRGCAPAAPNPQCPLPQWARAQPAPYPVRPGLRTGLQLTIQTRPRTASIASPATC